MPARRMTSIGFCTARTKQSEQIEKATSDSAPFGGLCVGKVTYTMQNWGIASAIGAIGHN